jgi:hypothetical protein
MGEFTDLAMLDTIANSNEGETITIVSPDGTVWNNPDGTEMTITLYGVDSDRWNSNRHSIIDRRNALKKNKISGKELDETLVNSLVAITKSWNVTFNGVKPECSPKNVKDLYVQRPWVKRLVQTYFDDESNFMKVLSKT